MSKGQPQIQFRSVSVSYGKKVILHDIDLEIPPNQITAVLGQSGCGKSTLLKTINRIVEEDGGRIDGELLVGGVPAAKTGREALRKKVGLVFQTPVVFPCSVEQNILYAHQYHYPAGRGKKPELAEAYLRLTGLYDEVKDQLHRPAARLSGGQQQRLAIARCLCTKPEVLMLDEPCSALDMKNTILIEELLTKLKADYTILIVTHNIAQAKRIADRVVFMDRGRVVEVNSAEAFYASPQTEAAAEYIKYMEY